MRLPFVICGTYGADVRTTKTVYRNASHEIQTPLAICRNRLEMLMEDDSLSEKQLEELMKTHQTLEYITKLNKSL